MLKSYLLIHLLSQHDKLVGKYFYGFQVGSFMCVPSHKTTLSAARSFYGQMKDLQTMVAEGVEEEEEVTEVVAEEDMEG